VDEIFLPGEIEYHREKENRANGIPIPQETRADIERLYESKA
jgi:LDH2 family malate/lactate/ureidoglycolate dehydrogenase